MSTAETRILHLHIPKTAGTAIRQAFNKSGTGLKIFPHYEERRYQGVDASQYDLFSGHFGFETAKSIGGNIVSVFRNPFDRFVSVYYFWRQLHEKGEAERNRKTELAMKYTLEQFVLIKDDIIMNSELNNRATWQIASGNGIAHRQRHRAMGQTDEDIFSLACENLETFALIGMQDRIDDFSAGLKKKFNISLNIEKRNTTKKRVSLADISLSTRRHIYDWISMDLALYERARILSVEL